MVLHKEATFKKDVANKKINVEREFEAPVEKVWEAWTKRELLDQWWAPRPWKAVTQSMDFRNGGSWLYYMEGPEGERHYCRVDYKTVNPNNSFTGKDAFCDENGKVSKDMPSMDWKVDFNKAGNNTKVNVEITFASEEDLNKIVEMGFQEGFAAGLNNLDELLAA
jgi:uncharacterized protein YndB with AHSA1/START domain